MQANNAIKKPVAKTATARSKGQTINLKNQQVDVDRLKPEAKTRLIEILSNRYEKNTSSIHVKNNQAVDRTASDFNELVGLIRTELNPQAMSETGKAKLIYLLHNRVEQQDKIIGAFKAGGTQTGTEISLDRPMPKTAKKPSIPSKADDTKLTTPASKKVAASGTVESFSDIKPALDYSKPVFKAETEVVAKKPLPRKAAANKKPAQQLKPASLETKNKAPTVKLGSEAEKLTTKTRQPIDLTDAHGQDAQMPEEAVSLLQRIVNSLKKALSSLKINKSASKAVDNSTPSEPLNKLPSQGMPKFNGVEYDEDDEEDEVDTEQLFELKDHFTSHSQTAWPTEVSNRIIEVLHLVRGEVRDVSYLQKGQSHQIKVAGKTITLAKHKGNDKCLYVFNGEQFKGEVRNRAPGGKFSVNQLTNREAGVFSGNAVQTEIPADSDVCMRNGHDTYIVRASYGIKAPRVKLEEKSYKNIYQSIAGSTAFHLLVLVMAGIVVNLTATEPKAKEPEFVKMELPKIEPPKIEKPKPKPKVVKAKPKPKAKAKVKPKVKPKAKPKTKAKAKPKPKAKPKAGGGAKGNIKKRDIKKSGLLAALGSKSGKSKPKRNLASITNLDAVSSSSSSAKLKVSGLKSKVSGSRMSLPTGELITSKGAADVLRSGGVGGKGSVAALSRGGTGTQAVAGRVTASMSKRVKIKGGLSRDQVKRVIDANMDDVTYCYESSLMNTPSLAGKAVFEWKVKLNGRVGAVNIKSSTVKSDEIHSCIKSAIKTWKFPQPSGGDAVFVSYPFIFDTVGF